VESGAEKAFEKGSRKVLKWKRGWVKKYVEESGRKSVVETRMCTQEELK